MMSSNLPKLFLVLFIVVLSSCGQKRHDAASWKDELGEYQYKGVLHVAADEGLESIIHQHEEVFEYYHDSVQVNVFYENERKIIEDFRANKVSVMLLTRFLEKAEIKQFAQRDTIYVRELSLAYDAVALVGAKNFNDSNLDVEALRKYFNPSQDSVSAKRLVFANTSSSIVRFVLDSLDDRKNVSPNVYAMESDSDVIMYVSTNENAIGFIPFNMVSDDEDGRVKELLKRIKILSLRAKNEKGEEIRVSANQSDIAEGVYPLIRTLNAVTRSTYADNLESLFVNFLAKEQGARIFLKAGLIPVNTPEREINVNVDGFKSSE